MEYKTESWVLVSLHSGLNWQIWCLRSNFDNQFSKWVYFFLVIGTVKNKTVLKPAWAGDSNRRGTKLKSSCFHAFMVMFSWLVMKTWSRKHENMNFWILYPFYLNLLPMLVSEQFHFLLYLLPKKSTPILKIGRQNFKEQFLKNLIFSSNCSMNRHL